MVPQHANDGESEYQFESAESDYRSGYLWTAQTVTAHAVQCARCGKYRFVPDERHYERIRERILYWPWVCKDASLWDSGASCEVPDEITENSRFILAVDRPGIPTTPPGWERTVHISAGPYNRGPFSCVFYFAPDTLESVSRTHRRMRSFRDIERTVKKNPKLLSDSVDIRTRFSFATPAPPTRFTTESSL